MIIYIYILEEEIVGLELDLGLVDVLDGHGQIDQVLSLRPQHSWDVPILFFVVHV